MEKVLRDILESGVKKFIICAMFCMAVLVGICPQTDTHILRTKQDGANVICAPASFQNMEVATRETLGQGSTLRTQLRLTTNERRVGRSILILHLCFAAVQPGFFLSVCRILFEFGTRKIRRKAFIIRFIHDLDGEKWAVS